MNKIKIYGIWFIMTMCTISVIFGSFTIVKLIVALLNRIGLFLEEGNTTGIVLCMVAISVELIAFLVALTSVMIFSIIELKDELAKGRRYERRRNRSRRRNY